jgi:hypothetical protein
VFGMTVATFVGVFFTPVFFLLLQRVSERQWPFKGRDVDRTSQAAGSDAAEARPSAADMPPSPSSAD